MTDDSKLKMDYDPGWINRGEVPPTQWKSTQQYLPPPYSHFKSHRNLHSNLEHSDAIYTSERDLSNQSHIPHYSSPELLQYFNFSPESHLSNEMNRNMKYPSNFPRPLWYNDNSTCSSSYHPFHRDMRLDAELDAEKYYSQACQHHLVNMCADPYLGNDYTSKTNHMPLHVKKRRKQRIESKSKRVKAEDSLNDNSQKFKTFVSGNYTYEDLMSSLNNPTQTCGTNSRYPTSPPPISQATTDVDSIINFFDSQHFPPQNKDESCCEHKVDFSNIYSSNDTNLKVEDFDEILRALTSDGNNDKPMEGNIFANNELEVSNILRLSKNADDGESSAEYSNRTDASVEEPPSDVITENKDPQTRDSICLEGGFQNVILQPIIGGRDENGEEVIIFLASSPSQQIPQETSMVFLNTEFISSEMTDSTENNKESISLNRTQNFHTCEEFQTEEVPCPGREINTHQIVINKAFDENYKEPGLQNEGTDIFFSNINDFVSKEAEVAIENNSLKRKRTKKKDSQLPSNTFLKKNLDHRKADDNILLEQDSETTEFDNEKLYAPSTSLIRSHEKFKTSYRPSQLKWKSKYKRKPKIQLKNFKNLFISEIIKLFQTQDVGINRSETRELLKNKIGSNVLQTIFTTIQQLAKSEIKNSRSKASKKK